MLHVRWMKKKNVLLCFVIWTSSTSVIQWLAWNCVWNSMSRHDFVCMWWYVWTRITFYYSKGIQIGINCISMENIIIGRCKQIGCLVESNNYRELSFHALEVNNPLTNTSLPHMAHKNHVGCPTHTIGLLLIHLKWLGLD